MAALLMSFMAFSSASQHGHRLHKTVVGFIPRSSVFIAQVLALLCDDRLNKKGPSLSTCKIFGHFSKTQILHKRTSENVFQLPKHREATAAPYLVLTSARLNETIRAKQHLAKTQRIRPPKKIHNDET